MSRLVQGGASSPRHSLSGPGGTRRWRGSTGGIWSYRRTCARSFTEVMSHRVFLDPIYELRRDALVRTALFAASLCHGAGAMTGDPLPRRVKTAIAPSGCPVSSSTGVLRASVLVLIAARWRVPAVMFRDFDLLTPVSRSAPHRSAHVLARPFRQRSTSERFEQKTSITGLCAGRPVRAPCVLPVAVDKMQVVADLCGALAASSRRIGDSLRTDRMRRRTIVPEFFLPATRSRGTEAGMVADLRGAIVPQGDHGAARACSMAPAILPGGASSSSSSPISILPFDLIERVFEALSEHDIIPIVLRDP